MFAERDAKIKIAVSLVVPYTISAGAQHYGLKTLVMTLCNVQAPTNCFQTTFG